MDMTNDTKRFIDIYQKYLQRLGVPTPRRKEASEQ